MSCWTDDLKKIFSSSEELLAYLEIQGDCHEIHHQSLPSFPCRVPLSFAQRMQKNNLKDPLLLQVLPLKVELDGSLQIHTVQDPLEEESFIKAPGILQKFQGRVLIVSTSYCPVHCRYCFRRHFNYDDNKQSFSAAQWAESLEVLRQDTSLIEVIFSGGDPLTLPNKKIKMLLEDLSHLDHIKIVRFHTRFPIVIPSRFDEELLSILSLHQKNTEQMIEIVLHINHAQEIDLSLKNLLRSYKQSGITLRNQAVLLAGINDSFEAQKNLALRCHASGVLPYYLHQFDEVEGAGHFYVPIEKGLEIMHDLRLNLPGYLVPLYVKEIPHAGSKVPLESYRDKFIP